MLFDLPAVPEEPEVVTVTKDPTKSGLEDMEDAVFRRYQHKTGAVIDRLHDMGLPEPGEQMRLITRRAFNAIELLQYVTLTEEILDLKMAIYSINFNAAKILIDMLNRGKIRKCEILMSNLRNKAHREKEEIIKTGLSNHPAVHLWFCSSHAKIMSCETASGNFYTIEGSGNHAYNSRLEQYVVDNDRAVFDFTCQWMREIRLFLAGKKELEDTNQKEGI